MAPIHVKIYKNQFVWSWDIEQFKLFPVEKHSNESQKNHVPSMPSILSDFNWITSPLTALHEITPNYHMKMITKYIINKQISKCCGVKSFISVKKMLSKSQNVCMSSHTKIKIVYDGSIVINYVCYLFCLMVNCRLSHVQQDWSG